MINIAEALIHLRPDAEFSINGETYDGLVWHSGGVPPTLAECEAAWNQIQPDYLLRPVRVERNLLLAASDWTQTPDAPVNAEAWAKYRQELRNLPATIEDPTATIVWPTLPT